MQTRSWKPEYDTGIDWIDGQHRIFLGLINRLIEYEQGRLGGLPLERLLAEVEAYARFHFVSEENFMIEIGYPGLSRQQQEHSELLQRLATTAAAVRTDADNIVDLHMQLLTWLIGHTVDSDKDIGVYLRTHPRQPSPGQH